MRCQTEAQKVKPIFVADKSWAKMNRIMGSVVYRNLGGLGRLSLGRSQRNHSIPSGLYVVHLYKKHTLSLCSLKAAPNKIAGWPWALWDVASLCVQYRNGPLLCRVDFKALSRSFTITETLPLSLPAEKEAPSSVAFFCFLHILCYVVLFVYINLFTSLHLKVCKGKPVSHSSVSCLLYHRTWHLGDFSYDRN